MWNQIKNGIQQRPKTLLFFIFLMTVAIRLPQLARPLSKHHELNTASVLVCLQVWNEQGLAPSKAAPVQFFPGTYNIFRDTTSHFKNLFNSGTYLSMGAGSYLLPWLVMKLFHIPPSPFSIRLWMLFIEIISVYLLYGLLSFFEKRFLIEYKNFAFIGCLIFLTAPVVMWFMGNSYSHETMVMPFYLLLLRIGFTIIENNYRWNAKQYAIYGLCLAMAIYTDWLGLMIAFVFFTQAISFKNVRQRIAFLLISLIAVVIPVTITCWQYNSLIGWQEYHDFIIAQLYRRSLPGSDVSFTILDYVKHFATGYGLLCITAFVGAIQLFKTRNYYLLLTAAIPLLHYLIFRGFSNEHDYSVLKWSPFIIVSSLIALYSFKASQRKIALYVIIATSVLIYQFINPPFAKSFNGEHYAWMQESGHRIASEAAPHEYIFVNTEGYFHQVEWYAHRNYKPVKDTTEARKILQQQPGSKAVFFQLNPQYEIEKVIRMTRQ